MTRVRTVVLAVLALVVGVLVATPATAASGPTADRAPVADRGTVPPTNREPVGPTVYVGRLTTEQLTQLGQLGLDHEDLSIRRDGSKLAVEAVLSAPQAAKLRAAGIPVTEKRVDGATVTRRMAAEAQAGYTVFRSYSEPGGIKDELIAIARQYPRLTKLVSIGSTLSGQPILAIKLTKDATRERDGARPAVLYAAAQHAREWITPEMNRRLLHHFLDSYATDPTVRRIVQTTELWFVPVANPDGYDLTFTPGNRLWRKNLRDNDGDGQLTALDGVDLNRNFSYHWKYDNE